MKKYYLGEIFNTHIKACIADSSTGRITLIYKVNSLYFLNEQIISTTPDTSSNISPFEGYLKPYQECTYQDILPFISELQSYLNSI